MTREEINKGKQKEIENEERNKKIKEIIKKTVKIIVILFIVGTIFFSYETYIATQKIEVREYRLENNKIPKSFDGLKIIQISDLHYGSTMFEENLKTIIKLSNERKPDIVIFTGDLINKEYKLSKEEQENITKQLSSIKTTLGKYAIEGDEDNDTTNTILYQSEFSILKNNYELIYNKSNEPFLLIGLSSLLKNNQDIETGYAYFKTETYNKDIYTITLAHEPDSTTEILENYPSTDLIISGHSHNGDIRIPFINYPILRKKGAYKYNKDKYEINNTKIFISGGLGTNNSTGIRMFTRPSINFYRLSSK